MPPSDFSLKPLASMLAELHWHRLRFLPRLNRWLRLDELSGLWRPDEAACLKAARELVEEAADATCNINLASRANVDAVLRCASYEPLLTTKIPEHELEPGLMPLVRGRA